MTKKQGRTGSEDEAITAGADRDTTWRVTARPPTVDDARCVSAKVVGARCSACIEACPRDALGFRGTEGARGVVPRVDPTLCDGCNLCIPACPSGALGRAGSQRPLRDGRDVYLACEEIGTIVGLFGGARVPCLHAFGLRDLARWREAGCERIVVPAVPCDDCPRRDAATLAETVGVFGRLAGSRGLASIRLEVVPLETWIARADVATNRADAPQPARRAFLRRLLGGGTSPKTDGDGAVCAFGLPVAPTGTAPARDALAAVAPVLDAERCDGCDVCVRLCPRGAWRRERGGLTVAPTACDGCGVCVDVCDRSALRLERLVSAADRHHPQEGVACRGCGHRFHRRPGAATTLCRVCASPRRSDRRDRVIYVGDFDRGVR